MTDAAGHGGLSAEVWHRLSLVEQLGNIGSEVGRALRAKAAGHPERQARAMGRALELFDLSASDPGLRERHKEFRRAREMVVDYLEGDNEYGSSAADLEAYFLQFAVAARR